jgi:hypothetical protein
VSNMQTSSEICLAIWALLHEDGQTSVTNVTSLETENISYGVGNLTRIFILKSDNDFMLISLCVIVIV